MVPRQSYPHLVRVQGKKARMDTGVQFAIITGSHFFLCCSWSVCYFPLYSHILHVPASRTSLFGIHPLKWALARGTEDEASPCSAAGTDFHTYQPLLQKFDYYLSSYNSRTKTIVPQAVLFLSSFPGRTPKFWERLCSPALLQSAMVTS